MMYVHAHNVRTIVIETREHPADERQSGFHVMEISVINDEGTKVGQFLLYGDKALEVNHHEA